jgi:hypothetical protein
MTTLRIYDDRNGVLAFDLSDLIDLLAPRSLAANWNVSPVNLRDQDGRFSDEFMIGGITTGEDPLNELATNGVSVSGATLSEAAHVTRQVIWDQFVATLPEQKQAWLDIRAIDSTFYEVTTSDNAVLDAIRSAFRDVRTARGPTCSTPIG